MNNKIFFVIIFNNDDFKPLINNIIFQYYKDYQCILLINNKKKILYDNLQNYLKLFDSVDPQDEEYPSSNLLETVTSNKRMFSNITIDLISEEINPIIYSINIFLKSNCNYFTWIYNHYVFDSFFLYNLIQIKSSFCYTSFKLNDIVHVNKKYDNLNDLIFNNNVILKSFMWNKDTIKKINDSEYNDNEYNDSEYNNIKTQNGIKLQNSSINNLYYNIFFITFKLLNIENIKYINKVLLNIKEEPNNSILIDSAKYDLYKKYCLKYYNIIDNNSVQLYQPNKNGLNNNDNNNNNIIISLSSIPSRFLHTHFEDTITSLYNQIIKPKYIILNLCNTYKRFENINIEEIKIKGNYLKNKYENLIINFVEDNGPITKILGLINLNEILSEDDKIIIVDDDWKCINTLTYYYNLAYELYNCDAIFINENNLINWDEWWEKREFNKKHNIIYENYKGLIFGWLTYSIKYKYLNKLLEYYNYMISINENIWLYDNLIISLFYQKFKINACGINLFLLQKQISILDTIDPTRKINNTNNFKKELEQKIMNMQNIENNIMPDFTSNNKKIIFNNVKNIYFNSNFIQLHNTSILNEAISKNVFSEEVYNSASPILGQVFPESSEINKSEKCIMSNNILDITYFNEKIFIITVFFNNSSPISTEFKIFINNTEQIITLENNNLLNKNTYFVKLENYINLELL
jgi:hypothetical protein